MADFFETLVKVNVNDHTEKKRSGGTDLTYLSWPFAVAEVTKVCPDMTYTVWRDEVSHLPYVYDEEIGYMVFTSVTIGGITRDMWLPVMDGANRAMKNHPYEVQLRNGKATVAAATMFDVNKTIMRCLVKNFAMFGLGLYIYAGEDLPEGEEVPANNMKPVANTTKYHETAEAKQGLYDLLMMKLREDGIAPSWFCEKHGIKDIKELTDAKVKKILTEAYWANVREAYRNDG